MLRFTVAAYLIALFIASVQAHDHNHPEFDNWYQSLKSSGGGVCCDGSDAFSVVDPDWEISGDHYRVRLNGEWLDVPPDRIVNTRNIVGIAKVWPYTLNGETTIRCFLPGSGA